MKTLVVGDVHGCFGELMDLINEADIDLSVDRLILLGDYIDRGPQSYEVVQYLQGLREQYGSENVILLRGNHEQMAIDFMEKSDDTWFSNGCETTINSLAVNRAHLSDMVEFFRTLPLTYTDDYFIFVHAGLKPGVPLESQQAEDLLWIREDFFKHPYDFGKRVVFGHTPTDYIKDKLDILIWNRMVALDTACFDDGYLSAIEIKKSRIIRRHRVPSHNLRKNLSQQPK